MLLDLKGSDLRIVGASIAAISAVLQVLMIGIAACDHLAWGERIVCLTPDYYFTMGRVALTIWCVAAVALLLGRFLAPYISLVAPGGVLVLSIWMSIELWSSGLTRQSIIFAIEIIAAIALFFWGPVIGTWLVGYGARRRRRSQSSDPMAVARLFD